MRTELLALSALLLPLTATAQETLEVSFTTAETSGPGFQDFRPRACIVVWLARQSDGAHVATVARWAEGHGHNLLDWVDASEFGTDGINRDGSKPVDGMTAASTVSHPLPPATITTGIVDISGVPDGDYFIELELADWEEPGSSANGRTTIPFVKDGAANTWSPPDESTFSNITAAYSGRAAGTYKPGVYAGPDEWISPTAIAEVTLNGRVRDDGGATTITWSLIDPPPSPCVRLSPDNTETTRASFCQAGIYVLGLTGSDGSLSTRDELTVYVNAEELPAVHDAHVSSAQPGTNFGLSNFMFLNDNQPGYVRFDATGIADTITAARLEFHGVESVVTTVRRDLYLVSDDTVWDESTVTWNTRPGAESTVVGSFLPGFGLNHADFSTAGVQDPIFTDGLISIHIRSATSPSQWFGMTTRQGFAAPELVVVKAWTESNSAPTAVAIVPTTAVADAAGLAPVSLDGASSTDPENNINTWTWNLVGGSSNPIATGENTSAVLDLGVHDIELVVEDFGALTDSDTAQVLVDDRWTGNDTAASAEVVTAGPHSHLFAHDAAGDWFRVTLAAAGGLDVDIAFAHADGNLDLHVYGSDGSTLVGESTSTTDNEAVSVTGLTAGDYLIHVDAASGNAVYTLTVDTSGAPNLTVSFAPTQVIESAGTVADLGTVTVDVAPGTVLSVTLTSDHGDVTPESPVLIAAAETSVTFDVTLIDDAVEEANATATVTANAAGHNAGSAVLTVLDDDGPLPTVRWSTDAQTVSETAATATVTVTLSETSPSDVVVPFTVSGTATAAVDFDVGASEITITNGDTRADLSFVLYDDGALEGDETVLFTIGTPTGAIATTPTVHLVTIADDESVANDGGPRDGGLDGGGDGEPTPAGDARAVPIVLESFGCTCDHAGTNAGAWLVIAGLLVRRRLSRAR